MLFGKCTDQGLVGNPRSPLQYACLWVWHCIVLLRYAVVHFHPFAVYKCHKVKQCAMGRYIIADHITERPTAECVDGKADTSRLHGSMAFKTAL